MVPLLFLLIVIAALALFYFGTCKNRKVLLYFLVWQVIISSLALLRVFEQKPGIFIAVIIGTILLTIVSLKNIKTAALNSRLLLSIHILRIPVELVLYQLYLQHKIPLSMTYKGVNFDIVMGISALLLPAYSLLSGKQINRGFFIAWNILGIGFLIFIVILAILSSPLPIQQFAFDQTNIAVLTFPYCLLPAVVVPLVLMAHILLLREEKRRSFSKDNL
ncbi:MAG: hypothetical protein JNM21_00610 [Taibaiella sp.]|nr:hypothetical protein [Taibaiella sp.]